MLTSIRSELFSHAFSMLGIIISVFAVYLVSFFLIKRWAKQKKGILPKLLQTYIYYPGLLFTFCISVLITLPLLEKHLQPRFSEILFHTFKVSAIALLGFLVMRAIAVFRELAISHYTSENPKDFSLRKAKTKFDLIQRVLNFLIILTTIAIILMTFKSIRSIGSSLLASAGVVGLVLGFAAQKSLSTLFAGIQIAITQPIRIEDVVEMDDAFGTIGEITLTYVVINSWDGRRIIVPINYFLEKSFENWTRSSPEIVGKVKIYADYSIQVDKLREEFQSIIEASPLWDRRKSGFIVTGADDKTVELRASMSARNSDDAWDLECHVREKLVAFINERFPESLPKGRSMAVNPDNKPK